MPTGGKGTADVTERKHAREERHDLQTQLALAQKMEAIGRLAGGGHDFNNQLSVMMGYAEYALRKTREGDPLRKELKQIMGAGERACPGRPPGQDQCGNQGPLHVGIYARRHRAPWCARERELPSETVLTERSGIEN